MKLDPPSDFIILYYLHIIIDENQSFETTPNFLLAVTDQILESTPTLF